jgi:hypothetical protein
MMTELEKGEKLVRGRQQIFSLFFHFHFFVVAGELERIPMEMDVE